MKPNRGEQATAQPAPPPQPEHEDLINRNIGRRYETPRRYETRIELERSTDGQRRTQRD